MKKKSKHIIEEMSKDIGFVIFHVWVQVQSSNPANYVTEQGS